MQVSIIGAGPAGLYLSYLLKRSFASAKVDVYERLSKGETFGFGIVFSDRALDFLVADDPETHAVLVPLLERWSDLALVHRGERVTIDGIGFAAIGRQVFLDLLDRRAREAGVDIHYDTEAGADAAGDLVVGADGVGSTLRTNHSTAFGTTVTQLSNRFIWYGTRKPFDTLTQTFVRTNHGVFNAHHYRYAPDASTFIVETNAATWERTGFAKMTDENSRRYCEEVFADALDGHALISNNSVWRRFPVVRNKCFAHGNLVLLGDALHTAHFSIGSGTRLALEDAIALCEALRQSDGDVAAAGRLFQSMRKPMLDKLLAAGDASAQWYESFEQTMALKPYEFAMSYINRSGRVDLERLRGLSPEFVRRYEVWLSGSQAAPR